MPKKLYDEHLTAHSLDEAFTLAESLDVMEEVPLFFNNENGNPQAIPNKRGIRNTRTDTIVGTVGGRYAIVQDRDLLLMVLEKLTQRHIPVGRVDAYMGESKSHINVRFQDDVEVGDGTNRNGDRIGFGVLLVNSYDGTTPMKGGLCALRFICNNGMVSKTKDLASVKKRHVKSDTLNMDESLDAFLDGVEAEMGGWVRRIQSAQAETLEWFEADLILDDHFTGRLSQQIWERLQDGEVQEHGGRLDRWTLYNAATHVLTHATTEVKNLDGTVRHEPRFNAATATKHQEQAFKLLTSLVPEPPEKWEPRSYVLPEVEEAVDYTDLQPFEY